MTGCDFDWMVSNHAVWGWKAPVKASVSGVSLLQLSPFFASIFPLFPPETPDTQASFPRRPYERLRCYDVKRRLSRHALDRKQWRTSKDSRPTKAWYRHESLKTGWFDRSRRMIVQNGWIFSICEIYWENGTAGHLVFWKPWAAVELKNVLSSSEHSVNQTLHLRSIKHFRIAWLVLIDIW